MRLLKFFVTLLLLTVSVYSNTSPTHNQQKLLIASEQYPPFEYLKDGKNTGISVEIIEQIMKKLNVPVEFQFYPFARVKMLLQAGKADAATSISYNKGRESYLYYSDSQKAFSSTGEIPDDSMWVSEYIFFINRRFSDSIKFDSYDQMIKDKYRVGVIRDYSYNKEFTDAKLDKYIYAGQPQALRALAEGVIDVFPIDRTVGLWLLKEYQLERQITFLSKPLFRKPYNLVFSKNSGLPDLKNIMLKFNEELRKMHASGETAMITRKHIPTVEPQKNTRPLIFVCEDWKPFEYIDNKEIKGLDVEVVDIIMKRLSIPYEIKIYPWSRACMLAQKGKVDAVLSISYKASREPILYYTQEQREFCETGKIPTDYLWKSEYVFFIKKSNLDTIKFESYHEIVNKKYKVGKNKDYSYNPKFCSVDFKIKTYNNTKDGLLALAAGDIDLYPMDKNVGLTTLDSLGLAESITHLPKVLFSKPYLAAFCKKSNYPGLENVMKAFYHELHLMRKSGEYKKIHEKHIK